MPRGQYDRRFPRRSTLRLSDLNLRTTAKYEACKSNGGHRPSGDWIEREYLAVPHMFYVCAGCGVPIRGNVAGWSIGLPPREDADAA